jgi:hypothetical protein
MSRKLFLPLLGFLILLLTSQITFPWTPAQRLTWTSGDSKFPDAAIEAGINSNNIHLVYTENISGNNDEIFYKKSTDGGATWSAAKRLTWNSGTSSYPSIAVDWQNNVHVAWQDNISGPYQIYYKKSTDGGSTWTTMKRLSWTNNDCLNPDLVTRLAHMSNGANVVGLHITWAAFVNTNFEIFVKSGYDWGGLWNFAYTERITWNSGWSWFPKIAMDSESRINLVWQDYSPGNYEIYYARSINGSTAWDKKRLTWDPNWSEYPAIAIDPADNIYVAWDDDKSGNAEIYLKNNDGHSSWSLPKRITWTAGDSVGPCLIAPTIMQPNVVWSEAVQTNAEIFYKASTDGGNTWPGATRLTNASGTSYSPVVQIDYNTQNVHVFWADNTTGNYEIYYKRKN